MLGILYKKKAINGVSQVCGVGETNASVGTRSLVGLSGSS